MEINETIATGPEAAGQTGTQRIMEAVESIRREIGRVIVGQEDMITLFITGMLAGGHLLIEGVPGIAKTLAARLFARTLQVGFSRIQFTPDLMPSDVIGTSVFNFKTSEFTFNKGPVFSNVVLIDEINRSPAKTQAALFEVMEEHQVTVDGVTYRLDFPFVVIATQNPVEHEGTYRLPEAQLDRFLYRIRIRYPSLDEEKEILHRFKQDFTNRRMETVQPVFSATSLLDMRQRIENIIIKDELIDYIAALVHHTRNHGDLFLGASPRASLAILRSAKALAAISGRDFVIPEDIRFMAIPVLNHRIIVTPEREMEGVEPDEVIRDIIQKVEVPR